MRAASKFLTMCVSSAVLWACGDAPATGPNIPDTTDTTPAPVATSLTVEPSSLSFGALRSRDTVRAVVRDAAGEPMDSVAVAWSVVRGGIVTVFGQGVVTAIANGGDTVRVTAEGLVADVPVRVEQVGVALAIGPHPSELRLIGASVTLDASIADSNGFPVSAPSSVSWRSSDTTVLLVDSAGTVRAAGGGSADIIATADTLTARTTIAVDLSGPVGGAITGQEIICTGGMAGPFPCNGMNLLSYLPLPALGAAPGVELNDVWGWTDPVTGAEYALVGRSDGTAFVNVTDPLNPVYVGFLPRTNGSPQSVWRDMKVYADHVFIVSDGAGNHGIQIFDLTQLRTAGGMPQTFTETARYTQVASVHNIAIDEATGFAFAVGSNSGGQTCGGGLHMVDIRNPAQPAFAGCFADPLTGNAGTGYTHDVQCVVYAGPDVSHQGREICFGSNENALSIADVTDKSAPVALSRASYPGVSYAHQGWLSPDHRYFFSDDELDELSGAAARSRTIIWDVTDLDDPIPVGEHLGPTSATDHNLYIVGNRLFASNYQAGIRVLDITTPAAPTEVGWLDTAPTLSDTPGFGGSWSNYPFFASGIVVVTSGDEGLFVLRAP